MRYCDQLRINSTADVTFQSGSYFFERGLNIDGEGVVRSDGNVLFYATCSGSPCDGDVAGQVRFAGIVDVDLTGMPEYGNVVVWVDRTSGDGVGVTLSGESVQGLTGSIYAIASQVNVSGQGVAAMTLNVSIVANQIDLAGEGIITIPCDPDTAPSETILALIE